MQQDARRTTTKPEANSARVAVNRRVGGGGVALALAVSVLGACTAQESPSTPASAPMTTPSPEVTEPAPDPVPEPDQPAPAPEPEPEPVEQAVEVITDSLLTYTEGSPSNDLFYALATAAQTKDVVNLDLLVEDDASSPQAAGLTDEQRCKDHATEAAVMKDAEALTKLGEVLSEREFMRYRKLRDK